MTIYDAHIHQKNIEAGGFIIGLEGTPRFQEKVLSNADALALHDPANCYVAFYYVSKCECETIFFSHKYLKYHPKREKYTPSQVIDSIKRNNPKAVIIDTLNEPYWQPYDYWNVAREFPNLPFIFAHSGGYSIFEFVKMCHLQRNIWIDFSLTHSTLGCCGELKEQLPYVEPAIKYALNAPFKKRILLASDFPFFSQTKVFKYYSKYIDQLNNNYLELLAQIT